MPLVLFVISHCCRYLPSLLLLLQFNDGSAAKSYPKFESAADLVYICKHATSWTRIQKLLHAKHHVVLVFLALCLLSCVHDILCAAGVFHFDDLPVQRCICA